MAKSTRLVAEICLYGNRSIGAGWLARTRDNTLLGDGEPREGRSFTEAVWQACDAIYHNRSLCGKIRPGTGTVRVFAAGGALMADTDLNHPGYFGDLKWTEATMLVVDSDAIIAAAK
jgi:hypothetical protein